MEASCGAHHHLHANNYWPKTHESTAAYSDSFFLCASEELCILQVATGGPCWSVRDVSVFDQHS